MAEARGIWRRREFPFTSGVNNLRLGRLHDKTGYARALKTGLPSPRTRHQKTPMTIETKEVVINFQDVVVELGGQKIYDRLSFEVNKGEFVCLLGPSGCGKSTSLRVMGGLLPITSGTVQIMGLDPSIAWPKIAYVFQSPRLVSWRNAMENVLLGIELRLGPGNKSAREQKALDLLALVGLSKEVRKYPSILSGGERQRVAIARALAVDPEIIFMDEPFSALDPTTRERMRVEIEQIWQKTGKTIVFVTHDIDEAVQLADRIILLTKKPTIVKENISMPDARPRSLGLPALALHRNRLLQMFNSIESDSKT